MTTIFLVTRKDVKSPRRLISESNEHTYGVWRSVIIEFNISKVIGIEDNRLNYVNKVFEVNLKTCRSRN